MLNYRRYQPRRDLTHNKETKSYCYAFRCYEMAKPFLCAMSGAKLWDRYFIHAAIPVNYTNELQEPFEVTTDNGRIMVLKNEVW